MRFQFLDGGARVNASCDVTTAGDEYVVAVLSSGGDGQGGVRNPERAKARELLRSRLGKLDALVNRFRIGEPGNEEVSVDPPAAIALWPLPASGAKALRLWVTLPVSAGISSEEELRSFLMNGTKEVAVPDPEPQPVDPVAADVIAKLTAYRNLIVEGVAGTGKSHLIGELRARFGAGNVKIVVFHPATAYEDFVEGLRPVDGGFAVREGVFLEACRQAAGLPGWGVEQVVRPEVDERDPRQPIVLVVDEINRANTAKVLGDLLYALEPSKRAPVAQARRVLSWAGSAPLPDADGNGNAQAWVTLQLERGDPPFRQLLVVPENLLILGTMNTTDRSVGTIDLALRRRFVFHRLHPLDPEVLREALAGLGETGLDDDIEQWDALNMRLRTELGPDAALGHSYMFDYAAARRRERELGGDPDRLNLWRDLLLPQIGEVLVAFNALAKMAAILASARTGGYTLAAEGTGIDAYPIVVPKAAPPTPDAD